MWRLFNARTALSGAVLLAATCVGINCGMIADTDRIVVAELDGKKITQGDLIELIYTMDDDERPKIRSSKDYLRVLNQYIDRQIKIPLGQQMANEGRIKIDRDAAREQFFKSSGDKEQEYRHMWMTPVPEPGEETELMKVYNLRAEDIQAMKNIIEQETDRLVEQMQGEAAVQTLAAEAYQRGELKLDPEALKLEYDLNKENLKTFEAITFRGLQFPASNPQSSELAARVRERIESGEDFESVLAEFLARDMRFGIESDIENNPSIARFQTFWDQVSGAEEGQIYGPIYMPEYARMRQNEQGQMIQETVPASYLVFKVLEHREAETLTLEEATPMIAGPLAYAEMMKILREEHGVEIYEDKLPAVEATSEEIFDY